MNACRGLLLATAALTFVVGVAHACDNPVFQYTLVHWARQTYLVLLYHRPDTPAGTDAEQVFAQVAGEGKANLLFHRLDVARLAEAPEGSLVGRVWERHKQQALPFYVVVSPNGSELFAGPMTAEEAERLAHSPQRTRLAELLAGGKEGLLLLLMDSDQGMSGKARQTVESALARLREAGHNIGWMVVNRSDAVEAWLVWQLLAVRPGLSLIKKPMLFGVFGKGHVMQPYIGEDITAEAVDTLVEIFNAPCTCDLVYELQGVDLLTDFDWAKAVSDEPAEEERPYYSLLTVPQEESKDTASVKALPAPATPAPSASGLARNLAVVLGGIVVVAVAVGCVVLKHRGRW